MNQTQQQAEGGDVGAPALETRRRDGSTLRASFESFQSNMTQLERRVAPSPWLSAPQGCYSTPSWYSVPGPLPPSQTNKSTTGLQRQWGTGGADAPFQVANLHLQAPCMAHFHSWQSAAVQSLTHAAGAVNFTPNEQAFRGHRTAESPMCGTPHCVPRGVNMNTCVQGTPNLHVQPMCLTASVQATSKQLQPIPHSSAQQHSPFQQEAFPKDVAQRCSREMEDLNIVPFGEKASLRVEHAFQELRALPRESPTQAQPSFSGQAAVQAVSCDLSPSESVEGHGPRGSDIEQAAEARCTEEMSIAKLRVRGMKKELEYPQREPWCKQASLEACFLADGGTCSCISHPLLDVSDDDATPVSSGLNHEFLAERSNGPSHVSTSSKNSYTKTHTQANNVDVPSVASGTAVDKYGHQPRNIRNIPRKANTFHCALTELKSGSAPEDANQIEPTAKQDCQKRRVPWLAEPAAQPDRPAALHHDTAEVLGDVGLDPFPSDPKFEEGTVTSFFQEQRRRLLQIQETRGSRRRHTETDKSYLPATERSFTSRNYRATHDSVKLEVMKREFELDGRKVHDFVESRSSLFATEHVVPRTQAPAAPRFSDAGVSDGQCLERNSA